MEIISGKTDFYLDTPTAVAVGKFDGIHIGHRRLLQEILEQKKYGKKACAFTFSPAPSVFFGYGDARELTTREEKINAFREMGVDILIEYPMNAHTASMSPEDFVLEVLRKQIKMELVAAGYDVSFGARGVGDRNLLERMGKEHGFEVRLIEKVRLDGREISSTYVREEVEKGNLPLVTSLLGMPYRVRGTVVKGNQLGRTMGIPTVNLVCPGQKLLPPSGVYFSSAAVEGQRYKAISNIGYRPTIKEDEKFLGVETYLYDFEGDLYGKEIDVYLYEFLREEAKFDSIEALRVQMLDDLERGRKYMEDAPKEVDIP